jgi:hypothetical protein
MSLAVDVLPTALAALAPHDQLTPDAYAAYLRGRFFWHRRALNYPENAQLAVDQFQAVTRAAPSYAPGYAALGQAYQLSVESLAVCGRSGRYTSNAPGPRWPPPSRSTAESAAAQAMLAWIRFRNDFDWTGADAGFRRALALEPNSADIHLQTAICSLRRPERRSSSARSSWRWHWTRSRRTIHDSAFYVYLGRPAMGESDSRLLDRYAQLVPDDSTPSI